MATATKKAAGAVEVPAVEENVTRGWMLSLLAIPAGIALWVLIWSFGFMASFVAFAIAWLAVYLYVYGAKAPVSRRSAPVLIGVIVVGVVLAFLAGMAVDAALAFVEGTDVGQWAALTMGEFWEFYFINLSSNGEMWAAYGVDIAIAVVFGVLGCYSIVAELLKPEQPAAVKVES